MGLTVLYEKSSHLIRKSISKWKEVYSDVNKKCGEYIFSWSGQNLLPEWSARENTSLHHAWGEGSNDFDKILDISCLAQNSDIQ